MASIDQLLTTIVESYLINGLYSFTALLSLIQIPAAVLCIRNYRAVKSQDYLLVTTFFVAGMINKGLLPLLYNPNFFVFDIIVWILGFIVQFTYSLWVFSFSLYMFQVKSINPPRIFLYVNAFLIFYITIIDTIHFTGASIYGLFPVIPILDLLGILIYAFWPLTAALLCCYVYFTINPIVEDKSTRIVIWLWRFIGIILTVDFAIQALFQFFPEFSPDYAPFITFLVTYTIMHFVFAFIALRHPESFLISQAQVLRAHKLYKIVKTIPKEVPSYFGMDRIVNYLNEIPESVFDYVKDVKQTKVEYKPA